MPYFYFKERDHMNQEFEKMCIIEPQLQQLYDEMRQVDGTDKHFCANDVWYRQFKPRLFFLVGYHAENRKLSGERHYDIAYQTLYNLLPPCRECCCF